MHRHSPAWRQIAVSDNIVPFYFQETKCVQQKRCQIWQLSCCGWSGGGSNPVGQSVYRMKSLLGSAMETFFLPSRNATGWLGWGKSWTQSGAMSWIPCSSLRRLTRRLTSTTRCRRWRAPSRTPWTRTATACPQRHQATRTRLTTC